MCGSLIDRDGCVRAIHCMEAQELLVLFLLPFTMLARPKCGFGPATLNLYRSAWGKVLVPYALRSPLRQRRLGWKL